MAENTTLNNDPEMEKLTKQVAKGGGITFFGRVVGKGISVITVVVLARFLGAEILGLYFLGMALLNLSGMVSRLGLDMGSIRFISIYHGEEDKEKIKGVIFQSLFLSFIVGIFLASTLFFSSDLIAKKIFNNIDLIYVIKLFSVGIPVFSVFMVATVIPRGFKVMKYFVYTSNIFTPLLNIALILFFFTAGLSIEGAIYAKILSFLIGLLLALYYIYRTFPEILDREIKPSFDIQTLLKFSIPLTGTTFLLFLIMWTDVLMIGYFLLPSDVGIYRVAAQIALLLMLLNGAFNSIFAPLTANLYHRKEFDRLDQIFKITTKWIFYLTLPVFLIIIFANQEILTIFGKEFLDGKNVLVLLGLAHLINAVTSGSRVVLIMSGREKLEFLNTFLIVISNIILNIILIPIYGIIGAAMATGLSIIALNLLRLIEVKKLLGIFPYDSRYLKGVISGIFTMMGVLISMKYLIGGLHYIIIISVVIVLTITIFGGSLNALKLDKEDKLILKTMKMKLNLSGKDAKSR